jgi:uncharacterized membrane protein YfcA
MQLLGIALAGLAVGLSLGLLGGGGAILGVPLLLALGVDARQAIASSLVVVAVTAALAAAGHARAGRVDWRSALRFGPATALGGFAGGRAAGAVDADLLLLLFAALMLAAAGALWRPRPVWEGAAPASPVALALAGAGIGALTGLVGAGGGFLFVPALVLLGRLAVQRAVGTSLVVIAANALAALVGQLAHVALRAEVAAPLTLAAALGALAGTRFAGRVSEPRLRRAFAVFLVAVAGWMLLRILRGAA